MTDYDRKLPYHRGSLLKLDAVLPHDDIVSGLKDILAKPGPTYAVDPIHDPHGCFEELLFRSSPIPTWKIFIDLLNDNERQTLVKLIEKFLKGKLVLL